MCCIRLLVGPHRMAGQCMLHDVQHFKTMIDCLANMYAAAEVEVHTGRWPVPGMQRSLHWHT